MLYTLLCVAGFIQEDRLRELLSTMGDRFTDDEVMISNFCHLFVYGTYVLSVSNYDPSQFSRLFMAKVNCLGKV